MQGLKSLAPRLRHSEEPLLLGLVSVGAGGAEGPVELGGGEASEDVEITTVEVVSAELELEELEVEEREIVEELMALEEARLPEASVAITVRVLGSVIEASRGPSLPQANGNAESNVAKLHAEDKGVDVELVELALDAAELVALALVVSVPVLEYAV